MDIFDGQSTTRVPKQIKKEKAIAAVIRRVSPDILLMVESPNLIEARYFVAANSLPYQVAHVRQQRGRHDWADGMVLLVKNGLNLKSVSLETPPVPGSRAATRNRHNDWSLRGLLVARIDELTFIGVHLKSPGRNPDKNCLVKRLRQAKGLVAYAKALDGPVVIAGDFNDGPGRGPLEKKFRQADTMAELEKIFKRASGNEKTHEGGFNIDHILVRGAEVSGRRVERTPWILSDHRAVWVVVSVR
ncbi:MAG: endonuclease/exonuclease/phosphatase family protein [Desulfobacteraceae bacterium]|nr:endonuclease/exonuclease/phosphatase family protein [Desulfobacteraceae bacterium]